MAETLAQAPHPCTQVNTIKRIVTLLHRLAKVTLGNGHEEDGLLFLFRKFMSEHNTVVNDIAEIKLKLSSQSEINKEIEIQNRVAAALAAAQETKAKADDVALKNGLAKRGISLQTVSVIGGIAVIVVTFIFQLLNYQLNRTNKLGIQQNNKELNNLGTPVMVSPRSGDYVRNSDSLAVKFFPKDFTGDTTTNINQH